jgi:Uma2 family endonuclease
MTTVEYLQTPETVLPSELAHGVLRVAESPTIPHQRVVRELAFSLTAFVERHRLGEVVFAPMDVVLDFAGALVVQPDILFVSASRSHLVTDRVYGAPDLVVEVLSPNPRIGQLDERVGWYARHGVRECWLAYQRDRRIDVVSFAAGAVVSRETFSGNRTVSSGVLPGLALIPLTVFGW